MPSHEPPQWLEVSIHIDPSAHESLSAYLFGLGCSGIVSGDPQSSSLKAYFPLATTSSDIQHDLNVFLDDLREVFPEIRAPKLTFRRIGDQDWSQNWRRFFHTERVTRKLIIVPAWEPVPSPGDSHIMRIDPGPAFGTGKHPTTRMCLAAMENLELPSSWTMLDIGTGSGILAIYGALLGASKIAAIDIDPDALKWAQWNIRLNGLEGFIELTSESISKISDSFSLVTANLTLRGILNLRPHLYGCVNPGGWLILSGLVRGQVNKIMSSFAKKDFEEERTYFQQDWACIILRKKEET